MSIAMVAGCFAAILTARIVIPILNAHPPRWYMAAGYWGIAMLKPPIIAITRLLEWLIARLEK